MRFWLRTGRTQRKLEFSEVSALVYTLSLVMGEVHLPMTPPNMAANSVLVSN